MNLLFLCLLVAITFVVYVRFTLPYGKKYERMKQLIDLESFPEAYDLIEWLSRNKYGVLVGYPETLLPYKAFCLFNLSRFQEAIETYDRILAKALDTKAKANQEYLSQLHLNKGRALTELEKYSQAIASFDKSIKYQPENPSAWASRASALSDLDKYHEAIDNCDRALQYQPDDYHTWLLRAFVLYQSKDYQNAMIDCKYTLQNQPENYLAWQLKGMIFYELGDYQAAINSCDRAIEIKPDDPFSFYGRACCYALLGEIDLAIASIKEIINLAPDTYQDLLDTNEDFDNIKQDQRFQELLNYVNQDRL